METQQPEPGHVVALDMLPTCDLCQSKPARWDAPMRGRSSWAYMCEPCNQRHARHPGQTGVGIGQRLIVRSA